MSRRLLLSGLGLAGLGLIAAACAPAAGQTPASTAAPAAGAAGTSASAPPATGAATSPAPTAAPAKRTFTPTQVRVASSTSPRGESARLVGIAQGFFQDFGVELEVMQISGTPDILRATVNNEVHFATVDVPTTLTAMEGGLAIRFLGSHEAKLGHVIFARPEIRSLKDLEGKSIGTTAVGGLIDNIEREIFRQQGVDASKVEFISLKGSSGIYQALVANKIHAGAATDAYLATAERDGLIVLVKTWEALPNYLSSVFLATDEGIQQNRELIVRTLAGYAKTFRFLRDPASKPVWVEQATSKLEQDPAQAEIAWQGAFEAQTYDPNLAFTREQFEYMQELNIITEKQQTKLEYERAVDTSLVQEALALL